MIIRLCFLLIAINLIHADNYRTCRECKNVDNPLKCPDTIICGKEEQCVSREFTNHLGKHAFRLGCESKNTCSILRLAQSLVGKRASWEEDVPPAPPVMCHECCDSDDCNSQLCSNTVGNSAAQPSQQFTGFITCRECKDVEDPASCSDIQICGYDEICVTSEFTNHLGKQAFRMGCQSKKTCDILKVAQGGLGKRGEVNAAPANPTLCHQCCPSHECNADLCNDSVINKKPVATSTNGNPKCGDLAVGFGDSCYILGAGSMNWTEARVYCQNWGGDLLVFNTREEHEFWVDTLLKLNAPHIIRFWIGGDYSRVANEWEWVDRAKTHYTPWWVSSLQHATTTYNAAALTVNPSYKYPVYKRTPLVYSNSANREYFICEKGR